MKLAILDRDGVINYDSDLYIKSPAEWRAIPGSIEAIARLNQHGFRVAVATNQSGIGRGLFDMATLNAINDKMMEMVFRQGGRIDAVFFCPHTDAEQCGCRKPRMDTLSRGDPLYIRGALPHVPRRGGDGRHPACYFCQA